MTAAIFSKKLRCDWLISGILLLLCAVACHANDTPMQANDESHLQALRDDRLTLGLVPYSASDDLFIFKTCLFEGPETQIQITACTDTFFGKDGELFYVKLRHALGNHMRSDAAAPVVTAQDAPLNHQAFLQYVKYLDAVEERTEHWKDAAKFGGATMGSIFTGNVTAGIVLAAQNPLVKTFFNLTTVALVIATLYFTISSGYHLKNALFDASGRVRKEKGKYLKQLGNGAQAEHDFFGLTGTDPQITPPVEVTRSEEQLFLQVAHELSSLKNQDGSYAEVTSVVHTVRALGAIMKAQLGEHGPYEYCLPTQHNQDQCIKI